MPHVTIGCSVMNQPEADNYRGPMAAIAALGWATHVWYEPALGPVDWSGWEFLRGIVAGGESGSKARPSHPDWYRATRDWCVAHGIPYFHKQWGNHVPITHNGSCGDTPNDSNYFWITPNGKTYKQGELPSGAGSDFAWAIHPMPKKSAGRTLDGRTWDEIPQVIARQTQAI
jgi:protein gp37